MKLCDFFKVIINCLHNKINSCIQISITYICRYIPAALISVLGILSNSSKVPDTEYLG